MPLLAVPVVFFLGFIWGAILLVFSESESRWMYFFLRCGDNAEFKAEQEKASKERQLREARLKEELKKIDEEEAAYHKKVKDRDQIWVDFSRIVRFRTRAMNFSPKDDELYISDDYARFEATDRQKKLTELEILKILILEFEEKYATEIEWSLKHPVESKKLEMEYGYCIHRILRVEKRMRVERNDPVADERERVEMCEKFGWDPTDPFYKLP